MRLTHRAGSSQRSGRPGGRRWLGISAGIILGAASALGGTAIAGGLAAGPATIHACYVRSTGALRVIFPSRGGRCRSTEAAIAWDKQGPPGPPSQRNVAQLGMLDWWGGFVNADEYGFSLPDGIAYDGTHMWVTNYFTSTVTEFNAADGKWIQTLRDGLYGFNRPIGIAFDGTDMWVANSSGDSVTEFRASDGAFIRTVSNTTDSRYGFGFPIGIAFDGTHLWVTSENSAAVTEIDTNGSYVSRLFGGNYGFNDPDGIAYDGSGHLWVTNNAAGQHGTVTEFNAADGSFARIVTPVGGGGWDNPQGIASDGTHMWVAVTGDQEVVEINISDGSLASTILDDSYGFIGPTGVAVDGTNVWVTSPSGNRVTELKESDGSLVQKFVSGPWNFNGPTGIAYDGSQMWVTNYTGNSVSDIVDR